MIQDILTNAQRVKLECLAQAVAFNCARTNNPNPEQIIAMAKQFESYVK